MKKRRMTKKEKELRTIVYNLTGRLITCQLEQFDEVQKMLFEKQSELDTYLVSKNLPKEYSK